MGDGLVRWLQHKTLGEVHGLQMPGKQRGIPGREGPEEDISGWKP